MHKKFTKQPPRFKMDKGIYFLTFITFKRYRLLHKSGIPELLISNLKYYENRLKELIAYTIMLEHIHLIVAVETIEQLSSFLKDFKKYTSMQIKNIASINEKHIWQRGTMDHYIRGGYEGKDFRNHLMYLFYNSKKHLNIAPKDFAYHNFLDFVDKGYFDIDFCDFDESAGNFGIYE